MLEKIKCPKCGENMEKKIHKIVVGPGRGPGGIKHPPEEKHFKYKCINSECVNYGKEFYENDL